MLLGLSYNLRQAEPEGKRKIEGEPKASLVWSPAPNNFIFMRYAIVIERGPTSYGAYVPDLPGCVAAAETREEVLTLIREAIEFHLEEMREDGLNAPEPSSSAEYVEVPTA
jgi:predicted RNase H-like HicB family nuclease